MSLKSLRNQIKRTRKKISKLARFYRQARRRNISGNLKRNNPRKARTHKKSQEEITRYGLSAGDIGEDLKSDSEKTTERSDD